MPPWLPISTDHWLYIYTAAYLVPMLLCARFLVRSRTGRAWIAIRDHRIAASSMGVNLTRYKTAAFGVSAFFTGIAGSLYAILVQFVAPDSFPFFLSITLFVGVVVGGLSRFTGPVLGAFFIVYIPTFTEQVSQAATWAIYGLIIIVCMHVRPTGLAGVVDDLLQLVARGVQAARPRALRDARRVN